MAKKWTNKCGARAELLFANHLFFVDVLRDNVTVMSTTRYKTASCKPETKKKGQGNDYNIII